MIELDQETINELIDSFHELYESIEVDLNALVSDPSKDRLNSLFRAIHNIKGHAAMAGFGGIVEYTHAIEDVAERLRSKTLDPSEKLSECILLGLDRLKDLHYRDLLGQNFSNLNEQEVQNGFRSIANSDSRNNIEDIDHLIEILSGGYQALQQPDTEGSSIDSELFQPTPLPSGTDRFVLDLAFFQELSFQLDSRNPHWVNRSIQLYDWGQKLNHFSNDTVDYQQLAAATYMHDIGMSFLNGEHTAKNAAAPVEPEEMKLHVRWAYDILIRMPGWEEAALIVLGHHERIDGQGYPNNLTDTLIHPGSKILAILDTFFDGIHGSIDQTQRKSILRVMSEINAAKGTKFDEYWVDLFNQVIKEEVRQGRL